MARSHRHHNHRFERPRSGFVRTVSVLWETFWGKPQVVCPKCRCEEIEYYDPFFFAPLRTLRGTRRFRCERCHFVWRKSRTNSVIPRAGRFN